MDPNQSGPGRMTYEPQPKEQLLWERVKQRSKPGETVQVFSIAENIGLHQSKAEEYIRRWENQGLCRDTFGSATTKLTDKGREVEVLANLS